MIGFMTVGPVTTVSEAKISARSGRRPAMKWAAAQAAVIVTRMVMTICLAR